MLISTKAGYYMWSGPYGEWGSRKYLVSSLDQSLKRMHLEKHGLPRVISLQFQGGQSVSGQEE